MARMTEMTDGGSKVPNIEISQDGDDVVMRFSEGAVKTAVSAAAAVAFAFNI